jgi:ABC-2 type transport system permease protein
VQRIPSPTRPSPHTLQVEAEDAAEAAGAAGVPAAALVSPATFAAWATAARWADVDADEALTRLANAQCDGAGIDAAVVDRTDSFRPEIGVFSPRSAGAGEVSLRDRLPGVIGLAMCFILWSLIITGASILLNSVMEEKSNKILEVLLSSASSTEILTGKVVGVALLTLTVLAVWGGIGAGALIAFAPTQAADVGEILLAGGMLGWFAAFMVGGYMMYAVLFAAIGAFCETPRDAQTLMGPIMMVLVIPILVVQLSLVNPDAPVVRFMSWVPFFTPFLMSARAPSEPPLIEVIGTMAGMFAVALLMVWLAGRAFRAGALSDVKLSWKSFASAISGGGR